MVVRCNKGAIEAVLRTVAYSVLAKHGSRSIFMVHPQQTQDTPNKYQVLTNKQVIQKT